MRKYLFAFALLMFALSIVVAVPHVFAEDYGLGATAGAAGLKNSDSVPTVAGNIIGTLLSMISVVFFILVLYGGIIYMTARGNSEQTQKAVNTIIGATIGIVIVMGAYALTNFVFKLGQQSSSGGGETTKTIYCKYSDSGTNKCKALTLPANISEDDEINRLVEEECVDSYTTTAACESALSN